MKKIVFLVALFFQVQVFGQVYNFNYPVLVRPQAAFYNTGVVFNGFQCVPANAVYLNCQLAVAANSGAYTYEVWGQANNGFGLIQPVLVGRSINQGNGIYYVNIPNVVRGTWQNFDLVARDQFGAAVLTDRMRFFAPPAQVVANPFVGRLLIW